MDKNKEIITRWDSAPHHKEIPTFPYHMHIKKRVKESKKVNLVDILDIIIQKVIEDLNLEL